MEEGFRIRIVFVGACGSKGRALAGFGWACVRKGRTLQENGTTPVVHRGLVGAPFFLCRQLCFKVHTHTRKKTSGNYACIYMSDKNAFICH